MEANRFDKRLEQISSAIWSKITQVDELKGQWAGGSNLAPQILGRLKKSVLVTSTGSSTRIEGAHLSDEAVEKLMRGLSVQKFSDRDTQEVRGYYELLENVFGSFETINFSEGSVKHLHKELLKYVEKDKLHRGEYKKTENKVEMINEAGESAGVLFDTSPAYLTPKEMQELLEWAQNALNEKKHHPLLIIGNFIVEFLMIHPFQDGNGRLSRILTNLLLLKCGYLFIPYVSHEKLIEDNKPDYYLSLRKSQKTFKLEKEDITEWLKFFLNVLQMQATAAIELLKKQNIESMLSAKQLAVYKFLETKEEATPAQISAGTNVARPTVNQVLSKLLGYEKIVKIGIGRATRYRKL
ncbi:MAG: hypothetical protein A2252_01160 [Elusimicrobia bacterium RIFOXYA2_FULL_39_19]|nr:MAG: hypothetical protein A2252_01160 [Elusimicrobia bacterium RIFOXYA2_FULL_39_19]